MKSIILAVALVLFASSAYSTTYVMETSNALEKEGITVKKVEWNFEHDRAVKVFSKKDGEIVLYKGYKPFFTSNDTFMVYGIIRAVSVTCYPYLNINMVYGTMFMVCGSCMS